MKIITYLTKLIPFSIKIKSLYWVNKEKEINFDLSILFNLIDTDKYDEAEIKLETLKTKWYSIESPHWFQLEWLSKFAKAEAMLNFLTSKE